MEPYTKERYTNIMVMPLVSEGSNNVMYFYKKPTLRNCKCTFIDGSVYWQKVVADDHYKAIKSEPDKLYLDKQCTVLAGVTRKQKIQECKRMGLI
ncbi:hypothetical protein ABES08_16920 [Peribacillus simplex]|uniref:hypothetical protein n=1 Tax=Peribacillus simplex TaxID=1478 RepID=UPI003D2A33B5